MLDLVEGAVRLGATEDYGMLVVPALLARFTAAKLYATSYLKSKGLGGSAPWSGMAAPPACPSGTCRRKPSHIGDLTQGGMSGQEPCGGHK